MRSAAAESPARPAHDYSDARFGLRFELPPRPGGGLYQFFGRIAEPNAMALRQGACAGSAGHGCAWQASKRRRSAGVSLVETGMKESAGQRSVPEATRSRSARGSWLAVIQSLSCSLRSTASIHSRNSSGSCRPRNSATLQGASQARTKLQASRGGGYGGGEIEQNAGAVGGRDGLFPQGFFLQRTQQDRSMEGIAIGALFPAASQPRAARKDVGRFPHTYALEAALGRRNHGATGG